MKATKKNNNFSTSETIELMEKLISIPSPYFEEDAIMQFVYSWFKENSIPAYIHQYYENKITAFSGKNIICAIEGNGDGPTICINAHLDTVKLCNGWTKDPYSGAVEDDKIFGLGALDMKSGCCSAMLALRKFCQQQKDYTGKIIATFVSDEEGPYGLGTNSIIEDGLLDNVDFFIVTEPSAGFNFMPFPNLCLGARGGYGLEVNFFGKSAHAALPNLGINAATDAAKFMCELENIEHIKDEFMGTGVACVVAVESDGGACSVPDYAKVKLFWHIVIGEDEKTIEDQIRDAIKRACIKSDYEIVFRDVPSIGTNGFMPYKVSQDDKFVKIFSDSIKSICECEANISYFQSIGDFNSLGARLKAPVIIFGAEGENFHGADEYASIKSITSTSEVIYDFLVKVLVNNRCS